ncbi:MAG: hypothetical protein KatS3mg050_1736 [Litorilinea sp.]|nr:MAG: hypothetical protein KatS3mg050_1736 [Litorilinea sp.]
MWKIKILLILSLLLYGCVPTTLAQSLESGAPLERLWVDMSMTPQLIDWFNNHARPDDIARVDHVSMIDLLEQVQVGRRLVVFKNVADAEVLLPHLADRMDIIGYNLEHGPANRPDEQADPVGSVRRMRALADQYGLRLALGPDHAFALSDGVAMAPYVDIFVLQIQRAQTEPETVREFVLPLVRQLRQANPEIAISVQVRTEGDMDALQDLLASLEPQLDGLSILTSPNTVDIARRLLAAIRPDVPSPSPTPEPEPERPLPVDTQTPMPSVTPRRPTPIPTPPTTGMPTRSWFVPVGLLVMGVLLGGLITTAALYAYQNVRRR